MPVTWKLSSPTTTLTEIALYPGATGLRVTVEWWNQQPDLMTIVDDGADYDAAPLFAKGAEVVLSREDAAGEVVWFRGTVRLVAPSADPDRESLTYTVMGGWDYLDRRAFLQNFAAATDVNDPASGLTTTPVGRVVLGQGDDGAKLSATAVVATILAYAIAHGAPLQAGAIDLGAVTIPWDETTDLQCSDAIMRVLQLIPDAVCWVDHSLTPPAFSCVRRPSLATTTLTLQPKGAADDPAAYAPVSSVGLKRRDDRTAAAVVLIYMFTNTTNGAGWISYSRDVYPPAATGWEEDAFVRTIRLAGSVENFNSQRCTTRPIDSALVFPGEVKNGEGTYSAIATFWQRRLSYLADAKVSILAFRAGTRTNDAGDAIDPACERELTDGAITDWMISGPDAIKQEVQKFTAQVAYDYTPDPAKPANKERKIELLTARLRATSAQTRTYTQPLGGETAESVPAGLAALLYTALNTPDYDGPVVLMEEEPSAWPRPGRVLNLTNGEAGWTTARAVIQSTTVDLQAGRTTINVGPSRQLGVDALVSIYKVNRGRVLVTRAASRTTGKAGAASSTSTLSVYGPLNEASSAPLPPTVGTTSVSPSGKLPEYNEIVTAIIDYYADLDVLPKSGDVVQISVDGKPKLSYTIWLTQQGDPDYLFTFSFFIGDITYYAKGHQIGIY